MRTFASTALAAVIVAGGVTVSQPHAQANGANSRISHCLYFKQKARFAKSAAAKAKYDKLHRQCIRDG